MNQRLRELLDSLPGAEPVKHKVCTDPKCSCYGKTQEQIDETRQNMITLHGWLFEVVEDDSDSPTGYNAHTHNLWEQYQHPDLQITLPLPPRTVYDLMHAVVARVKEGEKLLVNHHYDDIIQGFKTKFIWAWEAGRPVMRLVLPCPDGSLELHDMPVCECGNPECKSLLYRAQYEVSFPAEAAALFEE
jgi:hypothetical protein